jgi:cytosine/uracil/thiamine/allantoin permease
MIVMIALPVIVQRVHRGIVQLALDSMIAQLAQTVSVLIAARTVVMVIVLRDLARLRVVALTIAEKVQRVRPVIIMVRKSARASKSVTTMAVNVVSDYTRHVAMTQQNVITNPIWLLKNHPFGWFFYSSNAIPKSN